MNLTKLYSVRRQSARTGVLIIAACIIGLLPSEAADKTPRAEDVVEKVILAYGSRGAIYGIQRNGIIKSNLKLLSGDNPREGRTTVKFIRRKKFVEDLMLLELDLSETKYVIGFDGEKIWAQFNGETYQPNEANVRAFRSAHFHSYESLLRYKEIEAKLEYVSNQKIGPLELDVIDMIAPGGERTRYFISRKSLRILYLEYETQSNPEAAPVRYRYEFSDFRVIQESLVPFQIRVYEDGKRIEERKLIEVAYNVQLEESAFKAGDASKAAATETARKPGF